MNRDAPHRPRALRVVVALAAASVLTLGLAGCGAIDTAGRELVKHYTGLGDDSDPGFYVTAGGGGTGDTDVNDLAVGDCFDDPEDDPTMVFSAACDDEHSDEVTAAIDLPAGAYPGDIGIDKQARALCEKALEDYVAVDFTDSSLDYAYWTPDEVGWRQGDRRVVCYAYAWNYDPLTSSVKGSGL